MGLEDNGQQQVPHIQTDITFTQYLESVPMPLSYICFYINVTKTERSLLKSQVNKFTLKTTKTNQGYFTDFF